MLSSTPMDSGLRVPVARRDEPDLPAGTSRLLGLCSGTATACGICSSAPGPCASRPASSRPDARRSAPGSSAPACAGSSPGPTPSSPCAAASSADASRTSGSDEPQVPPDAGVPDPDCRRSGVLRLTASLRPDEVKICRPGRRRSRSLSVKCCANRSRAHRLGTHFPALCLRRPGRRSSADSDRRVMMSSRVSR